jgi:hypothetical protein
MICVCAIPCTKPVPCINHAYQHLYHTMCQPSTSTMYINMYHLINGITISCHTPCTIRYDKQVIPMVYLNNVSISIVDLQYDNQLSNNIIHISRDSKLLEGLTSIYKIIFQGLTSITIFFPNQVVQHLSTLSMDEIHEILTYYDMRIDKYNLVTKETTFTTSNN